MKVIYLLFFLVFFSTNSLAKSNVIYGGFSFGSILPENSLTRFVHDRSKGQSIIDKALLEAVKKINNKSFNLSFELLKDGLSEDDQNVLVLVLDDETINYITIDGDNLTRTDIILNFQVIFSTQKIII